MPRSGCSALYGVSPNLKKSSTAQSFFENLKERDLRVNYYQTDPFWLQKLVYFRFLRELLHALFPEMETNNIFLI